MRTYLIHYWIEKNDESVDCQKSIIAEDIESAIIDFKQQTKVFKHITKIEEI